ncbi:MAG TPA: TonB family protein [Methylophilus sp.]|nr:TonB family protein [Methylophilus sp.]
MTSLVFIDEESQTKVWRAVILSLGLHALVIAIYPTLSHITLPEMPDKLEIEFFTVKAPPPTAQQVIAQAAQTPPEPQKVTSVTKPQIAPQQPKSVLAAPANNEADYRVPEQVQQAKPEPPRTEPATPAVPATSAATATSQESASHTANESKETKAAATTNTQVANESDELSTSDNDAWGDYGDQLRSLVNKSKQYPTIAIRRHLEGDVMIVAQFIRGELVNVSLSETSKHAPLDEEAVRMVKKAIGQLGVKDSLKKKSFKITIPVSFRLE